MWHLMLQHYFQICEIICEYVENDDDAAYSRWSGVNRPGRLKRIVGRQGPDLCLIALDSEEDGYRCYLI